MDYGELIRKGLEQNKITVTKAAKLIGMTRQNFYNRLNSGEFKMSEINKLISKGIITKQKLYTIEQFGDYLLQQKDIDSAIMNLDDDKL